MNETEQAARVGFIVGAIIGSLVLGAVCGLLPLLVGRSKERAGLAWSGFGLCVAGGFIRGVIGAVPLALITTTAILIAGPVQRSRSRKSGAGRKARAPGQYDL